MPVRWRRSLWAALLLSTVSIFAQGPSRIFVTGWPLDLRIQGDGYFIVKDTESGGTYYTREGELRLDMDGYVVANNGSRLQAADPLQPAYISDLQIRALWTTAMVDRYWIETNGNAFVHCADGSQAVVGRIVLEKFSDPDSLGVWFDGMRTGATNGNFLTTFPGTNGAGIIVSGEYELPISKLSIADVNAPFGGFGQSLLTSTGVGTDLSLVDRGYFILRDTNSNALYATRLGAFYFDADGYLVNYANLRVQGYADPMITTIGDLRLQTSYPTPFLQDVPLSGYYFDRAGYLVVGLADGERILGGQILLADGPNPESLTFTNFGACLIDTNTRPWTLWHAPANFPQARPIADGCLELKYADESTLAVRRTLNFFAQEAIYFSSNSTDLAIVQPNLFFIVRDPVGGTSYATRFGALHLDAQNRLVNTNSFVLQGYNTSDLASLGDLKVDTNGAATASAMNHFDISRDGLILVTLNSGETFVRGQILLQRIPFPSTLTSAGDRLYTNLAAALPPMEPPPGHMITSALNSSGYLPPALHLPPHSGLRIQMSYGLGILQSSPDLIHWSDVSDVSGSIAGGGVHFETNITAVPQKFFRVKSD